MLQVYNIHSFYRLHSFRVTVKYWLYSLHWNNMSLYTIYFTPDSLYLLHA